MKGDPYSAVLGENLSIDLKIKLWAFLLKSSYDDGKAH